MKSKMSKKLMVGKAIIIISGVWIFLAMIFQIFNDTIWGYPPPPWVGQFVFIGVVLIIAWLIIIGIALTVGKLSKRTRHKS